MEENHSIDKSLENMLISKYKLNKEILDFVEKCEKRLECRFEKIDKIRDYNQYKVLKALQNNKIADRHFSWNTGYGYDDIGREATEKVYAEIFGTESALVRPTIVNGTHALAITLMGILRPGDEFIYCSGKPYDTLEEVIGIRGQGNGSLSDYNISYKEVNLLPDGSIDLEAVKKSITAKTKMVCVQRSTGYAWRKALTIEEIHKWATFVHNINPKIICMADNCYGEFTDIKEPTDVGVDVIAGSLIKNPGGGLALSGGYVCGSKELIRQISYRMTCPGIGSECGLTFGQTRSTLQGIFLAPSIVNGALKGALLCGESYSKLGYDICPDMESKRSDIIQAVELSSKEALVNFCQGIQAAAPIDSFVTPEPWDMPGYEDPVVMAAGAFVQGSSIELSADGPIRPPYIAYFQGGLTYQHSKLGIMISIQKLYEKAIINI